MRAVDGTLEIVSDDQVVLDEGDQTFLKGPAGLVERRSTEPAPSRRPSPDQPVDAAARKGIRRLGRPTTVVVASRADGAVALRLCDRRRTRLLVGREVLEPDGTVSVPFTFFTTIEVGDASTSVTDAPTPRRARPSR